MIPTLQIEGYPAFLEQLKARVASGRNNAARAVNQELIELYHYIGLQIISKQREHGWVLKLLTNLAKTLNLLSQR